MPNWRHAGAGAVDHRRLGVHLHLGLPGLRVQVCHCRFHPEFPRVHRISFAAAGHLEFGSPPTFRASWTPRTGAPSPIPSLCPPDSLLECCSSRSGGTALGPLATRASGESADECALPSQCVAAIPAMAGTQSDIVFPCYREGINRQEAERLVVSIALAMSQGGSLAIRHLSAV